MTKKELYKRYLSFFDAQNWKPLPYQKQAFQKLNQGYHGLINAPTGSGKTYSLLLPVFLEGIRKKHTKGLFAIWITPLRAIAPEIKAAAEALAAFYGLDWEIAIRTGDTPTSTRQKQLRKPPQILITTPESIHLLLATKKYPKFFHSLNYFIVDEWHELLGSKRAVLIELALSRLKSISLNLKIWGISATIGNLEEGLKVLLGTQYRSEKKILIRSKVKKKIKVNALLPNKIQEMRWAGNLGTTLHAKVQQVIQKHKTTLIFTNTRAQTERWYQELISRYPELAGLIALHHGSLDRSVRNWVENALHSGTLKAVVCTSSLDLGVDFRPVEAIIQIGSPKGVSRFFQRAGRSNHQPGASSIIYFLPTHSMEIIEFLALKTALKEANFESRVPQLRCFDVLSQYLVTLAVSEGFEADQLFREVRSTYCFAQLTKEEWQRTISFISTGGSALAASGEYKKVEWDPESQKFTVKDKRIAMRHRLSIGTIVSDVMVQVKFLNGTYIGMVEEWFVAKLFKGDHFVFAGRTLKVIQVKDNTVFVRRSKSKKAIIPSFQGGRMSLSSQLGERLKQAIYALPHTLEKSPKLVRGLVQIQQKYSILPTQNELLIEHFRSREGQHLFIFAFEGRRVHEAMASLLAYRIGERTPISFSLAFNDYGFELLTDNKVIDLTKLDFKQLFQTKNLHESLQQSINAAEMAKRRFRDIAGISGLIFSGFPGKRMKEKQLVSSTSLLFSVFATYDPQNLLYRQAINEVFEYQIEEKRLHDALERISRQNILIQPISKPTPFSLPIMVDRLRERLSTEKIEDRLERILNY